MSYTLIKGHFYIKGFQPDGDSMRFGPDSDKGRKILLGMGAKPKGPTKTFQLRFEAIDALETHYSQCHQHQRLAEGARDYLFKLFKFKNVVTGKKEVTSVDNDGQPGYILTRRIDNRKYGRPVTFVYYGKHNRTTGSKIRVDKKVAGQSANAKLVAAGQAYPAFYTSLPHDLRDYFDRLFQKARKKKTKSSIWKYDVSNKKTKLNGLTHLQKLALWPKFFRRLVAYYKSGKKSLSGFDKWLRSGGSKRDDEIYIISEGRRANLHDVFAVTGSSIRMAYKPEDVNVVEDPVVGDTSEPRQPKMSVRRKYGAKKRR